MEKFNNLMQDSIKISNDISEKQNNIKNTMEDINQHQNNIREELKNSIKYQKELTQNQNELKIKQEEFSTFIFKRIYQFEIITRKSYQNLMVLLKNQKLFLKIQLETKRNFEHFEKLQTRNYKKSKNLLNDILLYSENQKKKLIEHDNYYKNSTNKLFDIINKILKGKT
jgi:hypothetical protein